MIEDERGTFKKFWDNVNTGIRYLLGLLLFGFSDSRRWPFVKRMNRLRQRS